MNGNLTEQEPEPSPAVKRFSKSEVQSLVQTVVHDAVQETDTKMESLLQKVQQLECEPKCDFNIRKLEAHIKKVKRRGDAAMAFLRKMGMSGAQTKCTPQNQIRNTLPSAVESETVELSRLDSDEDPIEIVPCQKRKFVSGIRQNLMPNEKRPRMDDKQVELKSQFTRDPSLSPPQLTPVSLTPTPSAVVSPPDLIMASLKIEIPMSSPGAKPAVREWLDGVEAVKEEPVKEEPVKEEPVKEEPVKEEPVKEEPVKEEPVEEEPVEEVPVEEVPVEAEPAEEEHVEGPIKTLQPPAAGSAKTPRAPSGTTTQVKVEERKISARDDPLPGLPPLPPTTFPSVLPAEAASYSIPSQVKVNLAYIHNPPGISILWDLVEKDPTEPPMDRFRVCMMLEKGKGCGLFPVTWTLYEVTAIPLPMAIVIQIQKKMSGRKICFAVVGKDKFGRYGTYSNIKHALLP
ncbi:probable serine/threonine-protein kinase kinX [Osmerus eperlanus]|uniref:probable serine/threonine-protein kinase kinX n=1 Tax=Osmerus eperlanus TaxID=29151 RepID=UPI002E0E250E